VWSDSVAKTCRFRFPSVRLRREARQDLALPWGSLDELSPAVTPLRFLVWPLIRGPFPYAGVQPNRFVSFPSR